MTGLSTLRVIDADADIQEGLAHLAAADPVWAAVLPEIGPLPLRRREDGFAAILGAVVSQQLSTHAADAIARKLQAAGLTDPSAIAAASDEALRACGLSVQKIRYLRGIAAASPDWAALRAMPDDEVLDTLIALPGIGR